MSNKKLGFIQDGRVDFRDARGLWGMVSYAAGEMLRLTHGRHVHFIATGPAGENLCRTATLDDLDLADLGRELEKRKLVEP